MERDYRQNYEKALNRLNEGQKRAVETIDGPVLVIAGPGTGKTQILAARIGYILTHSDTAPHNILCLTYTDAGTVAMRMRLVEFIGPDAYNVQIHTFHSFCNSVIQDNLDRFRIRGLQPLSDLEKYELLQEIIDELPLDHPLNRAMGERYFETSRLQSLFDVMQREDWSTAFLKKEASEFLAHLADYPGMTYTKKYKGFQAGDVKPKEKEKWEDRMQTLLAAAECFEVYEEKKRKRARYDFNDMLSWVKQAFEQDESLLLDYQERFHYFLVDEYQDTNGIQNNLLKLLASYWPEPNLFVVGDDDQSIYRFQGANVKNIQEFYDSYSSGITTVMLDHNYRSSQQILDGSGALISQNKERLTNHIAGLSKNLVASGPSKDGVEPAILKFQSSAQQEVYLKNKVLDLREEGASLNEVAIIYHNHREVENLIKLFQSHGIPFNVKRRVNVLDEPLILGLRDILEYLHTEILEPGSGEPYLFRLMHLHYFNIDPRDIAKISRACHKKKDGEKLAWRDLMGSKERMFKMGIQSIGAIASLEANLGYWTQEAVNMTVQVLFEKILTRGGVLDHVMKMADRNWSIQLLTTFFDFIKDENQRNPKLQLGQLMATIERMERYGVRLGVQQIFHSEEGVNLVTAHSSKGLEFERVFILGAVSSNWESKRSGARGYALPLNLAPKDKEGEEEEERRLFYVAMTRAKKELTIMVPEEKPEGGKLEPSKFVAELEASGKVNSTYQEVGDAESLEYFAGLLRTEELGYAELVDHQLVDQALKNFKMSVTSLSKYLRCPLTFYFENIIKVPTARNAHMGFGSAVHYALEYFFRNMKEDPQADFPSKKALLKLFEKGMDIYRSHFTDQEYEERMAYAEEVLPAYYDEYIDQWNKNAVVEYNVPNAQVAGVPLSGKLDKLEFEGSQVTVVDYKTGNPDNGKKKLAKPTERNPDGQDYWRQLVFYKILLDADKRKDWQMVSGEMDFVQRNKDEQFVKSKLVITPEDISVVTDQIVHAYQGMKSHNFEGCGEDDCQWCNFVKNNFSSKGMELDLGEEE